MSGPIGLNRNEARASFAGWMALDIVLLVTLVVYAKVCH